MNLFLLIITLIIFCFGFVLIFGAPFVPTLKQQRKLALELLDLKEGQLLIELGAGDGAMLIEASRIGVKSVGYELNPILYIVAKLRTIRNKNVQVKFGNFWNADISKADAIYVFLLDSFMARLEQKCQIEGRQGLKLVSYTFELPTKKPKQSLGAMHLYLFDKPRQRAVK